MSRAAARNGASAAAQEHTARPRLEARGDVGLRRFSAPARRKGGRFPAQPNYADGVCGIRRLSPEDCNRISGTQEAISAPCCAAYRLTARAYYRIVQG